MSALFFSPSETLRSDLVKIQPNGDSVASSEILFNIPHGPGAVDLSDTWLQVELSIKDKSTPPEAIDPRQGYKNFMVSENFADDLWSDVQVQLQGVEITDNNGSMGAMASFYRKCLTKPAGYASGSLSFVSGSVVGRVPYMPGAQFADSNRAMLVSTDSPGETEALALTSGGVGFYDDRADGVYKSQLGVGGPNDARAYATGTHGLRAFLAAARSGENGEVLTLSCRPHAAWSSMDSLVPGNLDLSFRWVKESIDARLSQTTDSRGPMQVEVKSATMYVRRVTPVASAAPRLERPMRASTMHHKVVSLPIGPSSSDGPVSSWTYDTIHTGRRPDYAVFAVLAEDALSGANQGWRLSQYGSGRYAAAASDIQVYPGAAEPPSVSAPYGTITKLSVGWGSRRYPLQDYRSSDASQSGMPWLYETYKQTATRLSGGEGPMLSYRQFAGHCFMVQDFRELSDDDSMGALSIDMDLDRKTLNGTGPGAGRLRLFSLLLWDDTIDIDPESKLVSKSW